MGGDEKRQHVTTRSKDDVLAGAEETRSMKHEKQRLKTRDIVCIEDKDHEAERLGIVGG